MSSKNDSNKSKEAETDAQPPAKIRRTLKYEDHYLRSIPKAQQYEKSFMHRDIITHVFATENDFIITASQDGHLKFWKKKYNEGIEFVKHYRCHLASFADIAINHNGFLMATCCIQDRGIKIFDVIQFDMINMYKVEFPPTKLCWIHRGSDLINTLAVAESESGKIYIFDANAGEVPVHVLETIHTKPVAFMQYAAPVNVVISLDQSGMIEYWSNKYDFPKNVKWEFKTDTDLYQLCKFKQTAIALQTSPDGRTFTIFTSDRHIYVYDLLTAKIIVRVDETLQHYIDTGKETKNHGLPAMEWNRRIALEKELSKDNEAFRFFKITYDQSSNFLIYPTPLGINVFNIVTQEVVRKIGAGENIRFLGVSLAKATPSITEKLQGSAPTANIEAADNPIFHSISEPDPLLVTFAYKKSRFYLFTNIEPYSTEIDEQTGGRDIFNEKPLKEDMITAVEKETPQSKLYNRAAIYTTFGDIHIELYPDKCPKTVENFCTHAQRGYYNGHVFHRVIKSFMIQTGDPTGKGTGGASIWGDDFEDEFHPLLRHDKAFRVSMANAGPNTNGSQFFITVCPADWLDGKNTIFGQVIEGFNVVQKINQVPTHEKSGRPKEEISIISISLSNA